MKSKKSPLAFKPTESDLKDHIMDVRQSSPFKVLRLLLVLLLGCLILGKSIQTFDMMSFTKTFWRLSYQWFYTILIFLIIYSFLRMIIDLVDNHLYFQKQKELKELRRKINKKKVSPPIESA